LGITHFVDDLFIETPTGLFHVAEACAGLRFIIAALAFGALYALVIFRSFWRRATVMVLALVVPIIANGIRAMGIIVMAEWIGSAEAAAANHVAYGWGFFSVVILLLILAGLPFREDSSGPAPRTSDGPLMRPARAGALALSGALAVGLAAAGPAAATGLGYNAGVPAAETLRLVAPQGCTVAADGASLHCAGLRVSASLKKFSPRVSWGAVSATRWQITGGSDVDLHFSVPMAGGGAWQARQGNDEVSASAVATWLDGRPAGGVQARLLQAQNSLLGGHGAPVLVAVQVTPLPETAPARGTAMARRVLEAVLAAQGLDLAIEAAALSRGR
jgi:exosortase/archaeosortase family protein